MKFIFALLVATASTFSLYCQSIDIEVGPVIDTEAIEKLVEPAKSSLVTPFKSFSYSNGLFCSPELKKAYSGFGFQNKAFQFAEYDEYLKYAGVKKLASANLNDQVVLNAFITLNKKFFVLYTTKNVKQDQFTVYSSEVGADLALLGTPSVVHTFAELKNYGATIHVSSSGDKKFVLLTRVLDAKPKETQKLDCKMIDGTFTEVWTKRIETTIIGKEHSIQSVNVDNAGNMFTLIEHQNGRDPKPVAFAYYWESKATKTFEPGLPAGVNFGTRLELIQGVEPYFVGLNENDKGKEIEVKYFINRVNLQTQILEKISSGPMSADFRKVSNANLFDMRQWNVMNIIAGANGGIVASIEAVVMEEKYGVQHSFNSFVFSFRKDGSALWTRTIHKKQSAMPGMTGHLLAFSGDRVLFIYNDDAGNLTKLPDDDEVALFTSNNAMAMVQEFDASGTAQKYQLTKNKDLEGFALNFNAMGKIDNAFYFDTAIKINGRKSIDSRNLTLRIR
ncbi:MAG: hypothetical protein QM762_11525 [Chryseolinea sp.]